MEQTATRFLRRVWPAPLVFLCRNLGSKMRPDSGTEIPKMRAMWCRNGVTLVSPLSHGKKLIAHPNPGETSVCQFHGGCNLQPAPQAVGAAGLLEISVLECHKQLSARQGMWPLLVTELFRYQEGEDMKTSTSMFG